MSEPNNTIEAYKKLHDAIVDFYVAFHKVIFKEFKQMIKQLKLWFKQLFCSHLKKTGYHNPILSSMYKLKKIEVCDNCEKEFQVKE